MLGLNSDAFLLSCLWMKKMVLKGIMCSLVFYFRLISLFYFFLIFLASMQVDFKSLEWIIKKASVFKFIFSFAVSYASGSEDFRLEWTERQNTTLQNYYLNQIHSLIIISPVTHTIMNVFLPKRVNNTHRTINIYDCQPSNATHTIRIKHIWISISAFLSQHPHIQFQ